MRALTTLFVLVTTSLALSACAQTNPDAPMRDSQKILSDHSRDWRGMPLRAYLFEQPVFQDQNLAYNIIVDLDFYPYMIANGVSIRRDLSKPVDQTEIDFSQMRLQAGREVRDTIIAICGGRGVTLNNATFLDVSRFNEESSRSFFSMSASC